MTDLCVSDTFTTTLSIITFYGGTPLINRYAPYETTGTFYTMPYTHSLVDVLFEFYYARHTRVIICMHLLKCCVHVLIYLHFRLNSPSFAWISTCSLEIWISNYQDLSQITLLPLKSHPLTEESGTGSTHICGRDRS